MGYKRPPHYVRWCRMKSRCYNKNNTGYKNYGGRGIKVCSDWLNFHPFQEWCLRTYQPGKSLERVDNAGDYGPENCGWATKQEQALNRRNNTPAQIEKMRLLTLSAAEKRKQYASTKK